MSDEEIIVLFTSGEYSDYHLSGLRWVRSQEYELVKNECEALALKEQAIRDDLMQRNYADNIPQKEIDKIKELAAQQAALEKQRQDLWSTLRNSGRPVDFVEFWHGNT